MCFTLTPTTARNILGGGAINVRSTPTYHSKPIHYQQYSPSSSRMFITETDIEDKDTSTSSIVEDDSSESTEIVESTSTTSPWYKNIFKKKSKDDLSFKQKLAKMGMSVALSYGWVSNMSYTVTVSLAWYGFSKKTGLSPLAPGQWKPFLAVYAGFYVFNNFVRPIRLAVSAGVSVYFDRAIAFIQRKTNCSKGIAIGLMVFLANIVGTTTFMALGISLAAAAAGVPVFPGKP